MVVDAGGRKEVASSCAILLMREGGGGRERGGIPNVELPSLIGKG